MKTAPIDTALDKNVHVVRKSSKGKKVQKEQLTPDHIGLNDEPTFPKFMDLPVEVRDQIYSLAIGIPQPTPGTMISFKRRSQDPSHKGRNWFRTWHVLPKNMSMLPAGWHEVDFPSLNILQTSKQVYLEAFHHFYTDHTIAFQDPHCLYQFLCTIGSKRRRQLTSFFFDWYNDDAKDCFRMLKTCPNLKSVSFTFPCNAQNAEGLQALRDVRVLKQACVLAIKHTDATAVCNNDYWAVTADHKCHACGGSEGSDGLHAAAELELAMMRPRPKGYCRDDKGKGGLDLLKPARFGPVRSEVGDLRGDFVYKKRRKAKKKKKPEPYTFVLPPGRDLVQFDTGYN